jgi:predicted RND superfamily exporter protein
MRRFFKYPALIPGIIAAITVFFAVQIPRAELDNNNIRFLPKENKARVIAEYIDDTFGGQSMILVGLERPYGNVFEPEFLKRIRDYADAVETIRFVKNTNSIVTTQYISADGDSIVVDDMVPEGFSGTPEEIAELRRRISSWDMLRGSIVSDNLSATQIIINLDVTTEEAVSPEVTASIMEIRNIAQEMFSGMAEVYVTGQTLINATINEAMIKDNMLLIPLVVIIVLAVLFFVQAFCLCGASPYYGYCRGHLDHRSDGAVRHKTFDYHDAAAGYSCSGRKRLRHSCDNSLHRRYAESYFNGRTAP